MTVHPFDAITIEALRATGGWKWSAFPDCIGAFVAEMDFGTAPPVREAVTGAIAAGHTGYLPPGIDQAARTACADWIAREAGWKVSAGRVRLVPDVIAAFEVILRHFSTPGGQVVVPTPTYMPLLPIPRTLGHRVVELPMVWAHQRWELDLDGLGAALEPGAWLVLCNPANPAGRVFDRSELLALSAVVEAAGARVFSDEIHAPLRFPGFAHIPYATVSPTAAAHTVTAISASKAWNIPGLKCAQVILSGDADLGRWDALQMLPGHATSTLGAIAAAAAYNEGGPWLADVLQYLDGNRAAFARLVEELLPRARHTPPEGTYLGWVDVRDYHIDGSLGELLRARAKVAVVDGIDCGTAGDGFFRFNLATPRPILEQAVRAIAGVITGAPGKAGHPLP